MRIQEKIKHLVEKIKEVLFLIYRKAIYCSLNDFNFTMDMYIRLVVDMDYKAIKRINIPIPKAVFQEVYNELMKEYVIFSKNDKVMSEMKRRDTVESLYSRHELLRACAIALDNTLINDEQRATVLRVLDENGIRGENVLKRLTSEMKMLRVKIKSLQALSEQNKEEENPDKKKVSRADFSRIFAKLTEVGYIANKDMSVLDYIETLFVHSENMKRQQTEIDKLKNRR